MAGTAWPLRSCRTPISARYRLVEAVTGLLRALVVYEQGLDEDALLGLALALLLVPITLIDLDHRIIPNKLTLLGAVLAPLILALTEPGALPEHLIAGAAAGGFFLIVAIAHPPGMGIGDVKLAAVLGLFLGRGVAPALFVAFLAGTLVGAAIVVRKGSRDGRKTAVPFGPFLALGGVVALFAGDAMVDWYLTTFI
jgi:leader peptidase (prepilin peptidase) / N-methyltransferase